MRFLSFILLFSAVTASAANKDVCILELRNVNGLSLVGDLRCSDDSVTQVDVMWGLDSFEQQAEKINLMREKANSMLAAQGYQQMGVHEYTDSHYPITIFQRNPNGKKLCLVWATENMYKLPRKNLSRVDCNDGVVVDVYEDFNAYTKKNGLRQLTSIDSAVRRRPWVIFERN